MFYKTLFLVISLIFLSACATKKEFRKDMNNWVGSDIKTYIKHNGHPISTQKNSNGNTLYVYNFSVQENEIQKKCKRWVEVTKSKKIKKITWDGNYCVAYPSALK